MYGNSGYSHLTGMKTILLCLLHCLLIKTAYGASDYVSLLCPQVHRIPKVTYTQMKGQLDGLRKTFSSTGHPPDYHLLEEQFTAAVVDSIIPYWYGTPWDFNGTTQQPGKGAIACGYFVATVLRDAGVALHRIKTGQAASQTTLRQFADKAGIRLFLNKPLDSLLAYVRQLGKGLFIVGLDYHVGFLYNDGKVVWFIHSKWANPKAVVKEVAALSGVLYYSKYSMVGKISNNKALLKKWACIR
ncbi:hypothetical protein [Foetidibacter luteolus]|uniref:hypothetical protein n=1 Tax=Foetidibacter luteolus TaxID=2608880 RepID=UPI00129B8FD0|nr:hypothetical protein [Foetidibacter luteolus]